MSVIGWVKENPLTVAGVIGAGVILYLLFSSSGGNTTVISGVPAPDNGIDTAQLQLQAHSQALQFKLAETQAQTSAQVAVAQLQMNYGAVQSSVARDVSLAGITANENIKLAEFSTQGQLAALGFARDIAQAHVAKDIIGLQIPLQMHLADVQSQTVVAQARIAGDVATIQAWTDYWKVGEMKKAMQTQARFQFYGSALSSAADVAEAYFI